MEWFDEKLNCLVGTNDVNQKKNILLDIKIGLSNLPHNDVQQITGNLDFNRLLSELTSNDKDYIKELCDAIKVIIALVEPGKVHSLYSIEMSELLTHSEICVKILVLDEIHRQASDQSKLPELLSDLKLLEAIGQRIGDENVSVGMAAMGIFKQIGKQKEGLAIIYSGSILRTFARLIAQNDTVGFRVYDVVVDISKTSNECLQASINSGLLSSLISKLDSTDIFLQLNALEMITGLALSKPGLHYLEQHGVLNKLAQKIALAEETPLSNLLVPGLMKFFGNVARVYPNKVFLNYKEVVAGLFEVLQGNDQQILPPALDTLGHVASSVEGKYALQSFNDSMHSALTKIGQLIQNSPTELRVRALNNLACILNVPKDDQDNRILSLTKEWFDCVCEKPLDLIVSLCKQPFADIRQAALEVLAVIASQAWGQEYMCPLTSVINFLLDRNIETFKECKLAKYNIVSNLSHSPKGIFDANTMRLFKKFVNEGPFYVEVAVDVAIEGAS